MRSSPMCKSAEPFSGRISIRSRAEKSGAVMSAIFRERSAAPAVEQTSNNANRICRVCLPEHLCEGMQESLRRIFEE